tara:strand:+ start:217011 stop:217847 length:837 start_codon:yes stop_codon:yes gene_type:complete
MTLFFRVLLSFLCVFAVVTYADLAHAQAQKEIDPNFIPRSLYLEQAYTHFKVENSRAEFLSKRGVELYVKNRFINEAYEFLQERGRDINIDEINGIVVDLRHNTNLVHFLGPDVTGGIKGIFAVEFKGDKAVYVHFPKVPKYIENMYEVYVLAQKSVKGPCKLPYNTIVIREKDQYLAYSVVSEPHEKSIIMGGHFLLKISKKDQKWEITEYKPFDTLCVPVSKNLIDKYGRLAINYGAMPNEIHSFLSLQYNQELYIKTGTENWSVDNSIIDISTKK